MTMLTGREKFTNVEFETLMKATFDEIFITDGDGITLRVNAVCERLYGLNEQEIVGKSVEDLEIMGLFQPSITKKVIDTKQKMMVVQKTSEGRKLFVTAYPVFDDEGMLVRVVSVSRDITEISMIEKELYETQELLKQYRQYLSDEGSITREGNGFIYCSNKLEMIVDSIHQVAESSTPILLLGESGVGKEVLARYIHKCSVVSNGPFIAVNCGAIPETLFESELFGYDDGAFTGAKKGGKPGFVEIANGGTLFLDEIGETPLSMQPKLLRFLQEITFFRVGSAIKRQANVRIVTATNRDLKKMVENNLFREDLYYRLNIVPIEIPPLRKRKEDIMPLVTHYLQQFNKKHGRNKVMNQNALDLLSRYNWPGNVRELQNFIERVVLLVKDDMITEKNLPLNYFLDGTFKREKMSNLKDAVEEAEKDLLKNAMMHYRTTFEIAEALDVNQSTVVRKLKKYGIQTNKTKKM